MLKHLKQKLRDNKYLVAIVFIGFLLRVIFITHSMPFIFNADEPTIVRSTISLQRSLNPAHFDWPHLSYYINSLFYASFTIVRAFINFLNLRGMFESIFPLMWQDPAIFYVISRFVSALFGTATIVVLYKTIFEFYKDRYKSKVRVLALSGSLLFAFFPYHVFHAHFALLESTLLFFITLNFYQALLVAKTNKYKHYVWAGIFAGLAASIKYNGGLVVLNILIAWIIYFKTNKTKPNISLLIKSGVISVVTFLATTPYILLDFKTFIRSDSPVGFFWQFHNLGTASLTEYPSYLASNVFYALPLTISIVIWGLWVFRLINFSYFNKRVYLDYLLVVFPVVYLLYISQYDRNSFHYLIPIYPFILIFALEQILWTSRKFKRLNFKLLVAVISILMLPQLFYFLFLLQSPDTRYLSTVYINENAKDNYGFYIIGSDLPKIDEKRFKQKIVDSFEYNDLAGNSYPEYIIFSDDVMWPQSNGIENKGDWDKLYEENPLIGGFEVRFDGTNNLGPNIVIYKTGWEDKE